MENRLEGDEAMAKAHVYSLSQKAQDIISLVAKWRATPEHLRDHKSLTTLARAHGYKPDSRFFELAESAEVYQQLLVQHAGEAIEKIPSILEKCAQRALDGSAKHTEIYLEWCRKLITDTTFLGLQRPATSIADTLEHLTSQIDRIADFLNAVPVEAEVVTSRSALQSVETSPHHAPLASRSLGVGKEYEEGGQQPLQLPSNRDGRRSPSSRGELVPSRPSFSARVTAAR
jgi:hypothetical protein